METTCLNFNDAPLKDVIGANTVVITTDKITQVLIKAFIKRATSGVPDGTEHTIRKRFQIASL